MIHRGEMIKLLTTKGVYVIGKLANLLKRVVTIKYSCDTSDEVKIIVFEGNTKDVKRGCL